MKECPTCGTSVPDVYRDWLIERNWIGEWEATGPGYDVELDGDRWRSNGEMVTAKTRDALLEEIDTYIEEHET